MRKYHILISILIVILGLTFYGETITVTIHDTYYVIAAEVICFAAWFIFTVIYMIVKLKRFFTPDEI